MPDGIRQSSPNSSAPHFILPPGTQVVSRVEARGADGTPAHPRGALGIVVRSPADHQHSYRVRFDDGLEVSLLRGELAVLSEFQVEGMKTPADVLHELNLHEFVIYRCVIGSRAYGLNTEESDHDRRGIYLPPADLHWSLYGVPEQLENPDTEECYWEIQKFLTLALKANPNILECLYTPLVEHTSPLAREMLDMRESFLSRRVHQTYNGYVTSQFRKLEADIRNKGEPKWKHVMHLLRLLLAGITTLREGHVPVRVDEAHRQDLIEIRAGKRKWEELNQWRLQLHREFDAAAAATKLPEQPGYARVNAFLIRARRAMI